MILDLRTTISVESPAAGDATQCGTIVFRVRVVNASPLGTQVGDGARVHAPLITSPSGSITPVSYSVAVTSPGVVTQSPIGVVVPGSMNGALINTFPAGGYVEYLVTGRIGCNAQVAATSTTAWVNPKVGDSLPSPNQASGSTIFTINPKRALVTGTKTLCGGGTAIRVGHEERWKVTISNGAAGMAIPAGGQFEDLLPVGVVLRAWRMTAPDGSITSGTGFPIAAPAMPAGSTTTIVVVGYVTHCACQGPIQNCFTYCLPIGWQVGDSSTRCLNLCWDGEVVVPAPAGCVKLTDRIAQVCCDSTGGFVGSMTVKLVTPDGTAAINPRTGEAYPCNQVFGPYMYDSSGYVESCPLPRNSEMLVTAPVSNNGSIENSVCTGAMSHYEVTTTTGLVDEFGRSGGSCSTTFKVTLTGDDGRIVGDAAELRAIAEGAYSSYLARCVATDYFDCD